MAPVEKAEFLEAIEELRFLIKTTSDNHATLADKFGGFVKESDEYMKAQMEKAKTDLTEQISSTMQEAGMESARHKTELEDKIKRKGKRAGREEQRQESCNRHARSRTKIVTSRER